MTNNDQQDKITSYAQAEAFIMNALPMFQHVGRKALDTYDLEKVSNFLAYLGNPQDRFRSIHIAGTNGKGSVAHMLAAVYQKNDFKTGLFTSPHLLSYRERMKVNGDLIDEESVLAWVQRHYDYLRTSHLSFFEMSMGLACCWFADQEVDIVLMETGLGGRLDATNVITPLLAIITNIDYDHQDILGDSLELIAHEKAGIIKKNRPTVLGNVDPKLYPVFEKIADEKESKLIYSDRSLILRSEDTHDGIVYHLQKNVLPGSKIELPNKAEYHRYNLNTVLHALHILKENKELPLKSTAAKSGLENFIRLTGFRGRYEVIHGSPLIIADAAHNPAGLRYFERFFKNNSVHLHIVLGLVKGKNLEETFSVLPDHATYYFCAANVPRAMDSNVLQFEAQKYGLNGETWPSVQRAINEIILNANKEDIGLVMGSIYLLEEIL
ncbi:bifunctional folylpolyglutamate synthase/dihydrofolate synthase [Membranicola marinus]|uniref:Dihydrofolate synthase/folylpolyglutamate synthase n=1 Tax=Membranihabitans marinus TaxID=1227546 RepID=A0A953HPV1_9BACT|nr:Mur ligase family protein [Membranihabitans marinus]MBY5959994.1 bifunctional folylpolyglutamate synthase/dihydrofolate synthase [Membranihabitans marinus]